MAAIKKRNLVLGSDGFVGIGLCHYLESIGEEVLHYDLKRSSLEDARTEKLPLTNVDAVYFLAWDVGGAKYLYRDEIQFRQLDWNLRLLLNVMPQLRESQIPFVFISSQLAEVQDSVYGVTKRLGEVWTHLLSTGVRVRLWNVYGHLEAETERSHVVSDFVWQAVMNKEIKMMTTGEEYRQFIHVSDASAAFHLALTNQLKGIYDVTSFEWIKLIDLANIIAKHAGAKVTPGAKVGSTPLTPIQGKIPSWNPKIGLDEGIGKMVREAQQILAKKSTQNPSQNKPSESKQQTQQTKKAAK